MPSLWVISDDLDKEPVFLKLHCAQILSLASSNSGSCPWAFSQDFFFFLNTLLRMLAFQVTGPKAAPGIWVNKGWGQIYWDCCKGRNQKKTLIVYGFFGWHFWDIEMVWEWQGVEHSWSLARPGLCWGFGWCFAQVWVSPGLVKALGAALCQPCLVLDCGVGLGGVLFSRESSLKLDREQLPHTPVFCVGLLCTP